MLKENSTSLFQLLLKNEKEAADRIYLRQPKAGVWHELTWSEVMLQARKVAAFLQGLALKKGSHVSIFSKNCAEWFIVDFGIHLAGMVSVPLFANQNEESAHFVLKHAQVKLVFVGKLDDHNKVSQFIPEDYITVNMGYHKDLKVQHQWSDVMESKALLDLKEPDEEALYTIIYSSGTSGFPKGAMFTNNAIAQYLKVFPRDLLKIRDLKYYRLVSYLPLAHVYERSAVQLSSVTMPCSVSFIESLDKFVDNLKQIQPHLFTAVPRIWGVFQQKIEQKISARWLNFLLKLPLISWLIKKKIIHGLGFDACTNYFSGASPLPPSMMYFFDKLGIFIQEGYGQTENLAYATLSLLNERKIGYVGTPRLGVKVDINKESELLIHSPCMMSGYYKDKKNTTLALTSEGWLKTGDIAEFDEKLCVKILGRLSEPFKNQSGEFVVPGPIEQKFLNIPYIEQLCLVGRGLVSNVLIISLSREARSRKNKEIINKVLQERLHQVNASLVKFEKISHIILVKDSWTTENNLLTPTLKVKRRVVEEHYAPLVQETLKNHKSIIWE